MPENASRGRLAAAIRSRLVTVPLLAGAGVYLVATSYIPARFGRQGGLRVAATIEPLSIGIGAALLVLALLICIRRGDRSPGIDVAAPGNNQERR